MKNCIAASALVLACLFVATEVQAQGVNISSGGATYTWNPGSPQTATFVDPIAGNILFEDHWILRYFDRFANQNKTLSLDASNNLLELVYQGTQNFGDNAVSNWDINGTSGIGGPTLLYQVEMTHTIYTVGGRANLDYTVTITNVDGTPGSEFDLFNFFDYDINPFGSNSAQTLVQGSDIKINMQGDAADTHRTSFGADRHELRAVGVGVRITQSILGTPGYDLDGDPTTLTNVDVNAAVQWEDTMPPLGESISFSGTTGIVPAEVPVTPDSFKLADGVHVAGVLADVYESDDQYFELDPSPTKNPLKQKIHLILQTESPTVTPGVFKFTLESNMFGGPSGDVIQSIQLFNYATNSLELMDTRAVANADESILIEPGGDLSRFVHPITGEISAEIVWKSESFAGTPHTWSIDVDQAIWLIGD